ncbi:class II fructose-bisphosphate aldolase [Roseburia hominis]
MSKRTFSEELIYAKQHSYAVGAFNIFNELSARAVVKAAVSLDTPVILQTSVTTIKQLGVESLGAMLKQVKKEAPVNVLIHLDHCRDLSLAKRCIDDGWDAIMYDGSALPFEENIANCKEIAAYAHAKNVCVEGELGRISGVEDDIQVDSENASGASLSESLEFVRTADIDAFAPSIGTAHGVYKGVPHIDFNLVEQLAREIDTPIVIHGGTGLSEETFRRLIRSGASKVNVSTALKHAYLDNAKEYFKINPTKIDPLDFDKYLSNHIENAAKTHMEIFRKDRN